MTIAGATQVGGETMGKAVANSIGALDRQQLAVIDQAALDFEQAWQQGHVPRIEEFLRRPHVDAAIQGILFEELLTLEMEYRVRRGESPDVAKYQARFPHLAERVEAVFDYVCPSILHDAADGAPGSSKKWAAGNGELKSAADGERADSQAVRDDRPLPKHIGRFTILKMIAEGGFGRVLLAKDTQLNRLVAIKVSRKGLFTGEEDVSRFMDEASKTAQLKHPNIVAVHDVGRDGELGCFIVMDYIDGGSLDVEDAAGHMSYPEVASLIAQIADAVHYAHTKGLVHRDLKPSNILLDGHGVPCVADFGLAVHESVQQDHEGEISGTPPYMSPEQVRGLTHRMDGRTDIWTLGVLLYELLTGRRPFAGRTRAKVFDEVLNRDPKPLRQINDAIPVDLECICLKSLQKHPADRYSTALDLAEALRHAIANSPEGQLVAPPVPPPVRTPFSSKRRRRLWICSSAATALICVLALAFWLIWPLWPPPPAPGPVVPQTKIQLIATFPNAYPAGCALVEYSPAAQLVVAADGSGTVFLFAKGPPPRLLHAFSHNQSTASICLSRNGQVLAVLCVDDTHVHLYETCAPFRSIETAVSGNQFARLAPSPNDNEILLVQFNEIPLQIRDVITGTVTRQYQDGPWGVAQLVVTKSQLAVGGYDEHRGRWRISSEIPIVAETTRVGPICNLDMTPDGARLAYGGYGQDGAIQLADDGKLSRLPLPTDNPVAYRKVAFSDDGRRLVTVCWRTAGMETPDKNKFGYVSVWNVEDPSQPILKWDIVQAVDAVAIAPPYVCLAAGNTWRLLEIVEVAATSP